MARWTPPQPPPNTATPVDQALVTPANRPDVLLAVQHTQAVQTLHGECASIRQEIGALQTEIGILKADRQILHNDVSDLKHLRSKVIGGIVVLGLVIGSFVGLVWFFVGPTWATLQTMAAEYQVHKADEAAGHKDDRAADQTVNAQ